MKNSVSILLVLACLAGDTLATEPWQAALQKMPLSTNAPPWSRANCMQRMLAALQSNEVVKALIFLPGVSDDFYLVNRGQPDLNIPATNLGEAVAALTNVTAVRATFRPPFLLLHLENDLLEPRYSIKDLATAARQKQRRSGPHFFSVDGHWEKLQPPLQARLAIKLLPKGESRDAWHFHRHNIAAWHLTDWEILEALSLAGRTIFTVQKNQVRFQANSPSSPSF